MSVSDHQYLSFTETLLATIRLQRLDPYHPLRRRAEQVASNGQQTSRFARRILALPNSEQINPLQYAPWHPRESRENAQARIGAPMGRTKGQAAADFMVFQRTIPSSNIIIFSDGSRLVDGHAGGGYIGFQVHHQFLHSSLSYGYGKEVFNAEAEAALAGAQAAIAYPTAQFATNLWICLDNLEVATRLLSPSTGSSQEVFESFRTLAAAWPLRERVYLFSEAYEDLDGEREAETAPSIAVRSAALFSGILVCLGTHRIWIDPFLVCGSKTQALSTTQTQWQIIAPQTYQDLEITISPKRPEELPLNRLDLGRIIAARTGHGDFVNYHKCFNHDDAYLLCWCGA
ncbi:conserved hypothetical protein [Talaromyces stipitatus ATCC 10500]|uniref:RNase H type-1 domain-containing protein n=1 Tax=Talaromyces stipitatus (strain ATCC 10500 / CBS 375.48 / QM 6759 / NRRL 1006) TaxID=441959 RepID=B8M8Z7_TALSN|nr:uncharacterized protein TSTA_111360 [Talaromyces stipitatus ATCC 10500]EED17292.1 conserved hypothetical protein [Talaromyces stipitatus ATCC 10500]